MKPQKPPNKAIDPELASLDARIYALDLTTRTLKHQLSSYNFFIIGKLRTAPPRISTTHSQHFILSCDEDSKFVGEDHLLASNSPPPVRPERARTDPSAMLAQTHLSSAQEALRDITKEMRALDAALKDTFHRRLRTNWETASELQLLGDWMQRVMKRVRYLREDIERVVAMQENGWEVGLVIVTVDEWEFEMRAHQWRYRAR